MKATVEVRKALQSKLEEMIRNEEALKEVRLVTNTLHITYLCFHTISCGFTGWFVVVVLSLVTQS